MRRGSDRTEEVGGSGQGVRRDGFDDRDRDTGEADMVEGGCCGGRGKTAPNIPCLRSPGIILPDYRLSPFPYRDYVDLDEPFADGSSFYCRTRGRSPGPRDDEGWPGRSFRIRPCDRGTASDPLSERSLRHSQTE